MEILTTLGVPGAGLYFGGLLMILNQAFRDRGRLPTGAEPTTILGFGMALALMPALVVGNCLISAHASYVWILLSRHLAGTRRFRLPDGRQATRRDAFHEAGGFLSVHGATISGHPQYREAHPSPPAFGLC